VVTRHVSSHEIISVELANDAARTPSQKGGQT